MESESHRINKQHLVVLAHGIMGGANDLSYLGGLLENAGFRVLKSKLNERHRSLSGIEVSSQRLANEILEEIEKNTDLTKISFVGNSLGGIFIRYVIKLLYEPTTKKIAGLEPIRFMVRENEIIFFVTLNINMIKNF
jgi:esterase/lipase